MKKIFTKEWFEAAFIRALKTFAQAMLGYVAYGLAVEDINWIAAASVGFVSAVSSILMSIAGLPEVGTDGTLLIDTTDPNKDIYRMSFNTALEDLKTKKKVTVKVDPTAQLGDGVYLDEFEFKNEE